MIKELNNFGHDTFTGVSIDEAMRCCRVCNASTRALAYAKHMDSVVEEARHVNRFTCPECGKPSRKNVAPGSEFCLKANDHRSKCRVLMAT